jgi:hypothetical protein
VRCNSSSCHEKKSLAASERDEKTRTKFRNLTGALDVSKSIFLDEMGSNLGLTRLYGRAAPGQRVHDSVPGDRGGNLSTIGAMELEGIRTGLSVPGPIDGETMLFFVEELLVPTLKRGDIVVMDNNPIHKLDEIEDAIEEEKTRNGILSTLSGCSGDMSPSAERPKLIWTEGGRCFPVKHLAASCEASTRPSIATKQASGHQTRSE